jgi:hypothetical protein
MSDIDVEALRAMTPGCANRNHLNNVGAALLNSATIEAMTGYLQREALIGGYEAEQEAADEIDATYESLAETHRCAHDLSRDHLGANLMTTGDQWQAPTPTGDGRRPDSSPRTPSSGVSHGGSGRCAGWHG